MVRLRLSRDSGTTGRSSGLARLAGDLREAAATTVHTNVTHTAATNVRVGPDHRPERVEARLRQPTTTEPRPTEPRPTKARATVPPTVSSAVVPARAGSEAAVGVEHRVVRPDQVASFGPREAARSVAARAADAHASGERVQVP